MLTINIKRQTHILTLNFNMVNDWYLKTYIIKSNYNEDIDICNIKEIIRDKLKCLENNFTSNEFEYYHVGLAFLHYGNRGIDLSIWHLGKWGETVELFNCSWYCYGRNHCKMEPLDSAEPLLCQYEIKYLINELNVIKNTLEQNSTAEDFKENYIHEYLKI